MDVMDDGRWWTGQAVKPATGPFNPKSFQHLPPLNIANWNARATIEVWVPHEPNIKKDQKGSPSGPRPPVSHIELLPRETATRNIILETWCMGLFTGYGCTSLKVGVANGERAINYEIWGPLDKRISGHVHPQRHNTAYLHRSTKPRLSQDTCVIFASTPRRAEATESIACRFQQLKAWAFKPTSVHISWRQHSLHSAHSQSFTKLHKATQLI